MKKLVIIAVMLSLVAPILSCAAGEVMAENRVALSIEQPAKQPAVPVTKKQKRSMGRGALTGIVVGVTVAVVGAGLATAQATKVIDMRTWFKRPDVPVPAPDLQGSGCGAQVIDVPDDQENQAPVPCQASPEPVAVHVVAPAPEENLAPVAPEIVAAPGNTIEKQAPAAPVPVVVPVRPVKPRIEPSEAVLAAGRAAIARDEAEKKKQLLLLPERLK